MVLFNFYNRYFYSRTKIKFYSVFVNLFCRGKIKILFRQMLLQAHCEFQRRHPQRRLLPLQHKLHPVAFARAGTKCVAIIGLLHFWNRPTRNNIITDETIIIFTLFPLYPLKLPNQCTNVSHNLSGNTERHITRFLNFT